LGSGPFSQQCSVDTITATDYGTRVVIRLPKFEDDYIFGQAGVSGPGMIRFARFESDQAFINRETSRPEGLHFVRHIQ